MSLYEVIQEILLRDVDDAIKELLIESEVRKNPDLYRDAIYPIASLDPDDEVFKAVFKAYENITK